MICVSFCCRESRWLGVNLVQATMMIHLRSGNGQQNRNGNDKYPPFLACAVLELAVYMCLPKRASRLFSWRPKSFLGAFGMSEAVQSTSGLNSFVQASRRESKLPSLRHFLRFIGVDAEFDKYGFKRKMGAGFQVNHAKRAGCTCHLFCSFQLFVNMRVRHRFSRGRNGECGESPRALRGTSFIQ